MKLTTVAKSLTFITSCLLINNVSAQQNNTIQEWDIQTQAASGKIIQDGLNRFQLANPDFKAIRTQIPNDAFKTKLKIAFGANDAPCIFTNWGGGLLREYVQANKVLDLTPYLEKDPTFKDRFLPSAFDATTTNGKIYGLPGEDTAVAVIYYNKDIFNKLGLTPPKTWPELMTVIDTLKSKKIAPFALANKSKWPGSMYYMYLVDRIGGPEVFKNAVNRTNGGSFSDPAFIEAGKYLQDLVKAGAFASGFNGLDYDVGASRRLMYAGKAAMTLMGSWEFSSMQNENPGFTKKVDFFAFPSVPNGKGNSNDIIGSVGNNFYSVSASCPYPKQAYDAIKFMVDDTAAQGRLADSRLQPIKNLKPENPMLQRILDLVAKAPSTQLWYDQELPPQLSELHKDTVQTLLGLTITPEQAAQKMEDQAKKILH